jgi:hypothetical protein
VNPISAKARLNEDEGKLMARWGTCRDAWRDARAEVFEQKVIQDLRRELRLAQEALDEIVALQNKLEALLEDGKGD